MKQLGRGAAGLTALVDDFSVHSVVPQMFAGPLAGIHDPAGPLPDGFAKLKR
ncbi:hypothetical protein ACIQPP_48525 [Streptomyces violaceusniger]|uniref:hypothetical protein n=1 Tax=Streptomyces violaceusniger TaxID=68280 RepID=UPI001F2D0862|nr:hypothetical protein [Streptomyces hygroscopicus]